MRRVAGGLTTTQRMQAVPREARASGRKRKLRPPEHLYAPGPLGRAITEGRLPEEGGLLDHGLGVDEALDGHDGAAATERDGGCVGETGTPATTHSIDLRT
jgi:hypothetical protein